MTAVLIAINMIAGLFLIGVVLLQSGKGADMGAAFGGANSTMFGPSGPGNALTKATAGFAALFMLTSLGLAVMSADTGSVFDGVDVAPSATAPAASGSGDAAVDATPPAATPPTGAFDPEAEAEKAAAAAAVRADEMAAEAEAEANKAAAAAKADSEAIAEEADVATEKAATGAASEVEKAADAVDEKASEQ